MDSNVWKDGMANWLPANQVPELMAGVTSGYLPQPAPHLPMGGPPVTNTMALTSMILGILGIFVAWIFTSIPAIICGHIARRQIRNSGGTQSGDGMAIAGLITGYLMTLLFLVLVVGFFILILYVVPSSSGSSGPSPYPPSTPPGAPVVVPAPTPTPVP